MKEQRNPLQKGGVHKDGRNRKHYYSLTKSCSGPSFYRFGKNVPLPRLRAQGWVPDDGK